MAGRLGKKRLIKVLVAAALTVGSWFVATGSSKSESALDVRQTGIVSVAPTQSLSSIYPGPLIIRVPQAGENEAPSPAAKYAPAPPPPPRGSLTPIYPTPHFRSKGQ
jgi:hypothetical protein